MPRSYSSLLEAANAATPKGTVSAEGYAAWRAANPGVTRYNRGQTLNVPSTRSARGRRGRSRYVARERAKDKSIPTGPPVTGKLEPYTPAPKPEGAPEGFDLPAAQQFRGRPTAPQNLRYTPEIPEDFGPGYTLPAEQYEYFYGENPRVQAERRNAARRAELLEQIRAGRAAAESAARQYAAREEAEAQAPAETGRRFQSGQYGAQYGERPEDYQAQFDPLRSVPESVRPLAQAGRTAWNAVTGAWEFLGGVRDITQRMGEDFLRNNTTLYDDLGLPTRREAAMDRYRFGGANVVPEGFAETIGPEPTRGGGGEIVPELAGPQARPYDPNWVDAWLNQQETLTPEQLYMLQVVGRIEPEEGAIGAGAGIGAGGLAQIGQSVWSQPQWGGGGYEPVKYADQPGYGRSPGSMGLVNWRI